MKKLLKWIGMIVILLLLIIGGLALWGYKHFKMPQVTATFNYGAKHKGQNSTPFITTLKIYNPNKMSIRLDSVRYSMLLNGKEYLNGKVNHPFTIKASDTSYVSLPYDFKMKDFTRDFQGKDSAVTTFKTLSFLHLWKGKNVSIPYTYRKNMPIFTDLDIKVERIETKSLGLKQVKVNLLSSIYNPNILNLLVKNFSYVITIDSKELAHGLIPEHILLPKKQGRDITIPLDLQTGQLLAILASKKEQDKQYVFTAHTDVIVEDMPIYTNQYTFTTTGPVKDLVGKIKKGK